MNEKKFNQARYVDDYRKKHKAQFNVDLNIQEKEELEKLLKKCNLSKTQFLRSAIDLLRKNSSLFSKNCDK